MARLILSDPISSAWCWPTDKLFASVIAGAIIAFAQLRAELEALERKEAG